jgi:hypothetical protein
MNLPSSGLLPPRSWPLHRRLFMPRAHPTKSITLGVPFAASRTRRRCLAARRSTRSPGADHFSSDRRPVPGALVLSHLKG